MTKSAKRISGSAPRPSWFYARDEIRYTDFRLRPPPLLPAQPPMVPGHDRWLGGEEGRGAERPKDAKRLLDQAQNTTAPYGPSNPCTSTTVSGSVTSASTVWSVIIAAIRGASPPICRASV